MYPVEVIVLDGNQRSALAVTRSLGVKGIRVLVGAETESSLASSSAYCSRSFVYPSPYMSAGDFLEVLKDMTSRHDAVMLLPMTDVTVGEILENKSAFGEHVCIPLVDHEKYIAASDKSELFRLSKNLGIPMPRTIFSTDFQDYGSLISETGKLGFPLVLKPARSRIKTRLGWINAGVRYARDENDLRNRLGEEPFKSFPFVLQEKVEGSGIGVFLLMRDGEILAGFSHRRIREKPPSGGVSVLCESIDAPPIALSSATTLLRELNWYGVAMVEFKWDNRDNLPKLIEINARFWGSLQLAVSAGVDFPHLLYLLTMGRQLKKQENYRIGLRSRWELGDLDHLYLRLAKKTSELALPANTSPKGEVLVSFVKDFFSPSVRNEIFRVDDPLPFLFEVKEYVKNLFSWVKI